MIGPLSRQPPTELLSPAGDWDALRAAAANGADAVYFGLDNFNARHRATNFTLEELPQVIDFLHARNVKGYVTVNTLIFSPELEEVARLIEGISSAGADAVIVQDLGLVSLIRRICPDLPIHASTQMTLTEPRGIEYLSRLGASRVILARELTLSEIEQITSHSAVPVEVFVHGALCVAYSGQCLTSEAIGGRSANRGQCAQACRHPYELVVDGHVRDLGDQKYLLSPLDLAAVEQVNSLVQLGVQCLKIEGRLKGAPYVAVATKTYREALDAAIENRKHTFSSADALDLRQVYSRGFAPGFLSGINHQQLVAGRFPKARGVPIGRVVGQGRGEAIVVELDANWLQQVKQADRPIHSTHQGTSRDDATTFALAAGDGIVFDQGRPEDQEYGGRIVALREVDPPSNRLEIVLHEANVERQSSLAGSIVWKTDDPRLRQRAEQSFSRDLPVIREGISFSVRGRAGGALRIEATTQSGTSAAADWPGPLQIANRHPTTLEVIREQLGRLGTTRFKLEQVTLDLEEGVMIPKSVLNDLRRQLVEAVEQGRGARRQNQAGALDRLRQEISARVQAGDSSGDSASPASIPLSLTVLVRNLAQLQSVLHWRRSQTKVCLKTIHCDFEDVRKYREAVATCQAAAQHVTLATLRILKPDEGGLLHQIVKARPDAVLVRNLGSLGFFREHAPQLERVGDFSLNVANEISADLLLTSDCLRIVPSYDLNWDQLAALTKRTDPRRLEIVIHHHIPMFHMEHCVFAATLSNGKDWRDCGRPCDQHRVELRDRVGVDLPLIADTGCRNTVFQDMPQSALEFLPRMRQLGLACFRVDLLRESAEEIPELLNHYARVIAGEESPHDARRQLRVLNQIGIAKGTLQLL